MCACRELRACNSAALFPDCQPPGAEHVQHEFAAHLDLISDCMVQNFSKDLLFFVYVLLPHVVKTLMEQNSALHWSVAVFKLIIYALQLFNQMPYLWPFCFRYLHSAGCMRQCCALQFMSQAIHADDIPHLLSLSQRVLGSHMQRP